MSNLEVWLHPLRDYPRWFVVVCFGCALFGLLWVAVGLLRWSALLCAALAFVAIMGAFALWLWA
jgi:hypothetical protein